MDPILANFLLQNIGFPIVMQIIAAHKAAGTLATLTTEGVATEFLADTNKWIGQGQSWLAANPAVAKA